MSKLGVSWLILQLFHSVRVTVNQEISQVPCSEFFCNLLRSIQYNHLQMLQLTQILLCLPLVERAFEHQGLLDHRGYQ